MHVGLFGPQEIASPVRAKSICTLKANIFQYRSLNHKIKAEHGFENYFSLIKDTEQILRYMLEITKRRNTGLFAI